MLYHSRKQVYNTNCFNKCAVVGRDHFFAKLIIISFWEKLKVVRMEEPYVLETLIRSVFERKFFSLRDRKHKYLQDNTCAHSKVTNGF